jgi:hypothetical protein
MPPPIDWRSALWPNEQRELEVIEAERRRLDDLRLACVAKISRLRARAMKRALRAGGKNARRP